MRLPAEGILATLGWVAVNVAPSHLCGGQINCCCTMRFLLANGDGWAAGGGDGLPASCKDLDFTGAVRSNASLTPLFAHLLQRRSRRHAEAEQARGAL